MADVEQGYVRIANSMMDALAASSLTARQFKVMAAVIRKTYGYQKSMDWISNDQLADATGLASTRCSTVKNELIHLGYLVQRGRTVGPNKKLDEWGQGEKPELTQSSKGFTSKGESFTKTGKKSFTKTGNDSLPKEVTTKDTDPKEKKEKDLCRADAQQARAVLASQAGEVITHLNTVCHRNYPAGGSSNTVKGVMDRLKSGCTVEQLKLVIDHKASEWMADPKMQRFLQPSTLFKVSKIEENIANAISWLSSGKATGVVARQEGLEVPAPNADGKSVAKWLLAGGKFDLLSLGHQSSLRQAYEAGKLDGKPLGELLERQGVFA
ncbi:replication protein [Ferrimonas balearica]|uniref:replication protein n=1 Tax=Ferrimonas balearica TaxID=44012 RepID=UPI001C967CCA|nr:replication protein [Ferrimonas balearica]